MGGHRHRYTNLSPRVSVFHREDELSSGHRLFRILVIGEFDLNSTVPELIAAGDTAEAITSLLSLEGGERGELLTVARNAPLTFYMARVEAFPNDPRGIISQLCGLKARLSR